jgi:glutaredoxin
MSHRVVVYSKPGCHLCEDALRMLQDLRGEFNLVIEEIDITTDHALFKNYLEKIPVVLIDNRVTLSAPITKQGVVQALGSI